MGVSCLFWKFLNSDSDKPIGKHGIPVCFALLILLKTIYENLAAFTKNSVNRQQKLIFQLGSKP